MENTLAPVVDGTTVERVLLDGDLGQLSAAQRVTYYGKVCDTLGLNPLTRPFEYLVLNNKLTLYARREATEQLRKLHHVSLTIAARELVEDTYLVTARAVLPDGRVDESIGAKSIANLKGEARANAMMTAETKAKRRVTLSICGLGMLDESEVADIPASAMQIPPPAPIPHPRPAPDPDPDPPIPPPPAAGPWVHVLEVREAPTRNPKVTMYRVTLSSGEEVTTIKTGLASRAKRAREAQIPVRATIEKSKFGMELVALMTNEPPTVDEIPF
jgi:hypothetical protein